MSNDVFNLSELLTEYQNSPTDLLDNYCSSSIRDADIGNVLNDLTDRLAVSPDLISEESCFGCALLLL